MTYCSIEEAWGSDFSKPKKKKKKNRKKPIEDPIDPEILIPDTREFKPADVRVPNISFEDTSGIGAYDDAYDSLMSPYISRNQDPIDDSNKKVDEYNQEVKTASQIGTPSLDTDKDMVQIPRKEYEGLMNQVVEGFGNNVDEQFNQLLLYIFTGVFFVVMMDTMYQLGKKSY